MKRLCIFVVALMAGFTVPAIGSDEVDSFYDAKRVWLGPRQSTSGSGRASNGMVWR